MEKRYTKRELCKELQVSLSTLERHVKGGSFPAPEKIFGRPTWRESVVEKFLKARAAAVKGI